MPKTAMFDIFSYKPYLNFTKSYMKMDLDAFSVQLRVKNFLGTQN